MEVKLPNYNKKRQVLGRASKVTSSNIIYTNAASKTSKIQYTVTPTQTFANQDILCEIGELTCTPNEIISGTEIPKIVCGMDKKCDGTRFLIDNTLKSFDFDAKFESFINGQLTADMVKEIKCGEAKSCQGSSFSLTSAVNEPLVFKCEGDDSCQGFSVVGGIVKEFLCKGIRACQNPLNELFIGDEFKLECLGSMSCQASSWPTLLAVDTKIEIIFEGIYVEHIFTVFRNNAIYI